MNSLDTDDDEELMNNTVPHTKPSSSHILRPQRNSFHTTPYADEEINTNGNDDFTCSSVQKTCPIKDEIEMFPHKPIKPCRGKGAQLQEEEPTVGVYKTKCGFRTHRPLLWATALEDLVEDCRWDYTIQEDKYSTAIIKATNSGGMIIVEIRFTTGVVLVEGFQHEEWLTKRFEAWQKLAIKDVSIPVVANENVTPATKVETDDIPATKPEMDEFTNLHNDVEQLWEEHKSLKNAFTTLDSTVSKLSDDIQSMLTVIKDLRTSQEDVSKVTLSKNDDKLQVFLKTVSDDCVGNVSKSKVEMKSEIEKQKTALLRQESRFQSITDNLKNQLHNFQKPEASSVKWTHLENIRSNCTSTHSNLDNQFQPNVDSLVCASTCRDEMVSRHNITLQAHQDQLNELSSNVKFITSAIAAVPPTTIASAVIPPAKTQVPRSTPLIYQQSNDKGNLLSLTSTTSTTPIQIMATTAHNPCQLPPPSPSQSHNTQQPPISNKEVKLFVWTDSNGKFLKPEKFWKTEGTVFERTATIRDIHLALDRNRNTKIGCILISCGVNDVESIGGNDVAERLITLVRRVQQEHPSTKVVLSEVTPFHDRDYEVRMCNATLHRELSNIVHLVSLDSLRDDNWSMFRDDRKHIKEGCVGLFASLLIGALRAAHNMPPRNRNTTIQKNQPHKSSTPQPLMSIPLQQHRFSENHSRQNIPIGRRLQSIADGGNLGLGPKEAIMSKLTDLMKCLQGW